MINECCLKERISLATSVVKSHLTRSLHFNVLTGGGCDWYNDSILCWPPTSPASLVTIPCSLIPELDSPCHPGSAHLYCGHLGVWDAATNYSECLMDIGTDRGVVPIIVAYTYFSLSVISLLFLIICMYIFCS